MLCGHSPVLKLYPGLQMFRPVHLVVLAAKGKTGFDSLIEEVTLTGGLSKCFLVLVHSSMLAVSMVSLRVQDFPASGETSG